MSETYTHDKLIGGDFPLVTESATILDGQDVARGALMGKVTASGKLKICDSGNSDGSENPYAVMAEAAAPSGADGVATVYLTGQFNIVALTFGGTDTFATHRVAMRALSMFGRESIPE
jgi:hypothetical protein